MKNEQRIPADTFEERALALLTAEVEKRAKNASAPDAAEPARLRKGWSIAAVAVAVTVVLALVVSAGGNNTPAAFAVETNSEDVVLVEVNSLEDAPGLEAALGEVGVPASVSYLPAGMTCEEPRFQSVAWPAGARAISSAKVTGDDPFSFSGPLRFSLTRNAVSPGETLVITASANTKGAARGLFDSGVRVELAEGDVAACRPI